MLIFPLIIVPLRVLINLVMKRDQLPCTCFGVWKKTYLSVDGRTLIQWNNTSWSALNYSFLSGIMWLYSIPIVQTERKKYYNIRQILSLFLHVDFKVDFFIFQGRLGRDRVFRT